MDKSEASLYLDITIPFERDALVSKRQTSPSVYSRTGYQSSYQMAKDNLLARTPTVNNRAWRAKPPPGGGFHYLDIPIAR